MKSKRMFLTAMIIPLFLILANCSVHAEELSGSIQIKGSDTMVNLGQAWAEQFMEKNPDTSIAVTGGGSGTGIAAIINGTCDIAQSSRSMKPQELEMAKAKSREVVEMEVAVDALAVIVNPSNPVGQLSIEQLSDIFTGKVTNWKDVGGPDQPILALSRERNSGTHVYFLEHIVRKGNEKGPEEFGARTLMLPSSQAISEEVSQSPAAIGYVGIGYVTDKQKKIAVGSSAQGPFVLPSVETAMDKTYPVARGLYMYVLKNQPPLVKALLDFVLGPEGQEIVRQMDFVPLSEKA